MRIAITAMLLHQNTKPTTKTMNKTTNMNKKTIAVWFSCGAASAVAAKKTIEKYGDTHIIRIINNPIAEEHEDNRRFLLDVEKWLGIDIEIATNPKFPDTSCETVWEKQRYMSGVAGAPCTKFLKKAARQEWERTNHHDFIVLGFTSEETSRQERFSLMERSNAIPVLIDCGISKADCYLIIQEAGIRLPEVYYLGYPNANCIGCVKASSPTYWNHVRKVHPDIFRRRAEQSRDIGCRLVTVKSERLFLDELDPEATGRPMKNMEVECGIFCGL